MSLREEIPLGEFVKKDIEIDLKGLAKAVNGLLVRGSKKGVITADDIMMISDAAIIPRSFSTVAEGISQGSKFFDLLVYFSIEPEKRPAIGRVPPGTSLPSKNYSDISRAMFYVGFFLLTRANLPTGKDKKVGSIVPSFLVNVLSFNEEPESYKKMLSTFDLGLLDNSWIRYIDWKSVGAEAMNRFALGVAGYRMFAPFKLYEIRKDANPDVRRAAMIAKSFATQPPDWSIHPITRDPSILSRYGNLNKNAANLILECFTSTEIDEMVRLRILFEYPVKDARFMNWRTWDETMVFVSKDPIF